MDAPNSPWKPGTTGENEGDETNSDSTTGATDSPRQDKEPRDMKEPTIVHQAVSGELRGFKGGCDSGYHSRNNSIPEITWSEDPRCAALVGGSLCLLQVIEAKQTADRNLSTQAGDLDKPVTVCSQERSHSSSVLCPQGLAPGSTNDSFELQRRRDHFWKGDLTLRDAIQPHQGAKKQQIPTTGELESIKVKHNKLAEPLFEPVVDYPDDEVDAHKLKVSENAKLMEPELKRLLLDVYVNSALNYHLRDRARGQYAFLLHRPGITDEQLSAILESFGIRSGLALGHGLWDPFAIEHAASLAGVEDLDITRWIKNDSERAARHRKHDGGDSEDNEFFPVADDETAMFTIEEWTQVIGNCRSKSSSSSSSSSNGEAAKNELVAVVQAIKNGRITWWEAPAVFKSILDIELLIDDLISMLKEFEIEPAQWLGLHAREGHQKAQIKWQIDIMKRREESDWATNCTSGSALKPEYRDTDDLTEDDTFHRDLLNAIDDIRSGKVDLAQVLEFLKDLFGNIEMSDTELFVDLANYDISPKQWKQPSAKGILHDSPTDSNPSTSIPKDISAQSLDLGDSLRRIAENISRGLVDVGTGSSQFKELLGNSIMTDDEMHKGLTVHRIPSRQLLDPQQQILSLGLRTMYNAFCGGHIKHTGATQWCRALFGEPNIELADLPDELNRHGLSTCIVPPQLYEGLGIDMKDIQTSLENNVRTRKEAYDLFIQAFEQRLLDPAGLVPYLDSIEIPSDWIAAEIAAKPQRDERSASTRSKSISKMTGLANHMDSPNKGSPSPDIDMDVLWQLQTIFRNLMSLELEPLQAIIQFRSVLGCPEEALAQELATYGISIDEIFRGLQVKKAELLKRLASNMPRALLENGESKHFSDGIGVTSTPVMKNNDIPSMEDSVGGGDDGYEHVEKGDADTLACFDKEFEIEANRNDFVSIRKHLQHTHTRFIRGNITQSEASFHFRKIIGAPNLCDLDLAKKLKIYEVPSGPFLGSLNASTSNERSFTDPKIMSTGKPSTDWPCHPTTGIILPVISPNDFSSGMESPAPPNLFQIKIAEELLRSSLAKTVAGRRGNPDPTEPATPMMAERSSKRSVRAKLRRHNADKNAWFANTHEDQYKRWTYQRKLMDNRDRDFKLKTNLNYAYVKYGKHYAYRSAVDRRNIKAISSKAIGPDFLWGLVSSPAHAKELGLKAGIPERHLIERFNLEPSGCRKRNTAEASSWESEEQKNSTMPDLGHAETPTPLHISSEGSNITETVETKIPEPDSSGPLAGDSNRNAPMVNIGMSPDTIRGAHTPCFPKRAPSKRDDSSPNASGRMVNKQKCYGDLSILRKWTETAKCNKNVCTVVQRDCKRDLSISDPNDQLHKKHRRESDLSGSPPLIGSPDANKYQSGPDRSPSKRNASNPDPNDQTRKQQKRDKCAHILSKRTQVVRFTQGCQHPRMSSKSERGRDSPCNRSSHKCSIAESKSPLHGTDDAPLPEAFDFLEEPVDGTQVPNLTNGWSVLSNTLATNVSDHERYSTKPKHFSDESGDAPLPDSFDLLEEPSNGTQVPEWTNVFTAINTTLANKGSNPQHSLARINSVSDEIGDAPLPDSFDLHENPQHNAKRLELINVSPASNDMLATWRSVLAKDSKALRSSETMPDQSSSKAAVYQERCVKLKKAISEQEKAGVDFVTRAQSIVLLRARLQKLHFGDENMSDEVLQKNEDATARLVSALTQSITPKAKECANTTSKNLETSSRIGFYEKYSNYTPGDLGRIDRKIDRDRESAEAEARGRGIALSDLINERIQRPLRREADTCNDNSYFGHQGTAPSAPQYPASLHKLFDSYRGMLRSFSKPNHSDAQDESLRDSVSADQPKDNPDVIGIEGAMKYLQTLGINLDEVSVLVISEALQSPTMGEFTREGYLTGWQRLA